MKYVKKHISWNDTEHQVEAYNRSRQKLGSLVYERTGKFMHWCWYQEDMISMSPGCLEEVRQKQKELHNGKIEEAKSN